MKWIIVAMACGNGAHSECIMTQAPNIPYFASENACNNGLLAFTKGLEETFAFSARTDLANSAAGLYQCKEERKHGQ